MVSRLPGWNLGAKNMNHLKEESARAAAIEYIRRQLRQGNSLAKLLLHNVDFGNGYIVTLSASSLTPAEAIRFDCGHEPPTDAKSEPIKIGDAYYPAVPTPKTDEQLAEAIHRLLQNPQSACFLENHLAEAHDPWLQRAKSRIIAHGSEVYHALFSGDRDKPKIEAAISEWYNLPTSIGALGSMNEKDSAHIESARTITIGQLTAFAEAVQSVFVGAYDGEGYIIWEKQSEVGGAPLTGHNTWAKTQRIINAGAACFAALAKRALYSSVLLRLGGVQPKRRPGGVPLDAAAASGQHGAILYADP